MEDLTIGGITFDQQGFTCKGRRFNWQDVVSAEETVSGGESTGHRNLKIKLAAETLSFRDDDFPGNGFTALRVLLKEIVPERVNLQGPRYLKFGPEECEFTISMAKFLHKIGRLEESKFAYTHAIQLVEYYHNPKHVLLCEVLEALSALSSEPRESAEYLARAQSIKAAPRKNRSFLQNLFMPSDEKRKLRDKLERAFEEFRRTKGREPKRTEKARILDEIQYGNDL